MKPKVVSLTLFAVLLLFVSTIPALPSFAATTAATCSAPTIAPKAQVIHTSTQVKIAKISYCTPSNSPYHLKQILETHPSGVTKPSIPGKSTGVFSFNVFTHGTYTIRFEWTSGNQQLVETATVLSEA
jgi:hypothetical protein